MGGGAGGGRVRRRVVLLALAAATVPTGVWVWRGTTPSPGEAGRGAFATPIATRRETRPTLDPARFVGKARRSHEVAREIPDVLDRLYCYCACDRFLGHQSLLSCYTDGHAPT